MVAGNIPLGQEEPLSNNGVPMVGAKMWFYEFGSSDTLKDTYQNATLTTLNTNPVVSDANGRLPSIFGRGGYRQVLKDPSDNQIWSKDIEAPFASANVSTAVEALLGAETLQQFWDESYGPTALAAAIAAISLLPGPIGLTGLTGATGPTGPAGSSPNGYQPRILGTDPGCFQFPNANGGATNILIQGGVGTTGSNGSTTISFQTAFPGGVLAYGATATGGRPGTPVAAMASAGPSSITVSTWSPLFGGSWYGASAFSWWAIGY